MEVVRLTVLILLIEFLEFIMLFVPLLLRILELLDFPLVPLLNSFFSFDDLLGGRILILFGDLDRQALDPFLPVLLVLFELGEEFLNFELFFGVVSRKQKLVIVNFFVVAEDCLQIV